MTLVLDLSTNQEKELHILAEREGLTVEQYVIVRILPAETIGKKLLNVADYVLPPHARKSAAEIDAVINEINAGRDEWDERETALQHSVTR